MPLSLVTLPVLFVGAVVVGSRFVIDSKADKWAIHNGVSVLYSVKTGLLTRFYFDDAGQRVLIWRLSGPITPIPYGEIADVHSHPLPPKGSFSRFDITTRNKEAPLISVQVWSTSVPDILARFTAHVGLTRYQ